MGTIRAVSTMKGESMSLLGFGVTLVVLVVAIGALVASAGLRRSGGK